MDVQTIIVGLIIAAALFYVGKIAFDKIKSFSSGKSCASDCGCAPKSKRSLAQNRRV